ncbi:MAG: GAF domain-containing protein [Deltaproteobacteria bacterium]|nr:GAF domain-containing protein [Deltaproteobacteria bacterium]
MEKEVSCINTKAILDYVSANNNGDLSALLDNLDPYIHSLSEPEIFLRDQNNWVSCGIACKLLERARTIFNDEMIVMKIAKHSIENASIGYIQKIFLKGFWSYKTTIKYAQKVNDRFNRSKTVEIVELKRNGAIVRLHWDSRMELSKDLCLMNHGYYTYMPLVWGGRPTDFTEVCCYFEGAPYCEYHIKWPVKNRFHEIGSRFFTSKSVLAETIVEMEADKRIIEQKYEEVNRLNEELNYKIKQLLAIQDTGKAILSVLDLEQLLTVIMNTLSNICKLNRVIIMLVNESKECLEYIYGIGLNNISDKINDYTIPLHRVSNILVRVMNTGQPEYIPEVKSSSLRKDNLMLAYGKPTSVYVVPLITRSKVIGVIATDAVDGKGIPKETRETIEVFAPQIAIAIENARLYRKLQEQMLEIKKSKALLSRAEKLSFLGNIAARLAHEIKNPMTAIGTFLQMFPYKYNDEEFRGKFYSIAMEETERVNNLISELLDLVKTRESRFELNDIHQLIEKMILLVSPQSNAKKINVIRQFDERIGHVWLDPEKIKEVTLNLLSNAVEFTPEKGVIEVVTEKCNGDLKNNNIRIKVRDNGVGIPSAIIDKIFDPYFTTKHKSDMHNGTGLGLFIASQNMSDHKGTIDVKSRVREGTEFILTLPINPSPEQYRDKEEENEN